MPVQSLLDVELIVLQTRPASLRKALDDDDYDDDH